MKKSLLMKTMLLLFALVTSSTCAWADSYTITFGNSAKSATAIDANKNASTIISDGTDYVTAKPFTVTSGNCYYGGSTDGEKASIRVGKSGNAASLSITLSDAGKVKATSIVVNCFKFNDSNKGTLAVNGMTAQSVPTSSADDLTFTFASTTNIENIVLSTTKATFIYSITVNYSSSSKEAAGLSFAIPSYEVAPNTIFSQVVTNPNSLAVTYASDDEDIAYVDPTTGEVLTGDKIGTATITASSAETPTYDAGLATYTITVYDPTANDGSEAKPYTVTEALALINILGTASSIPVYVKGIVSTGLTNIVNDPSKSYDGSATYYISADGTTSNQLMIYGGFNIGKTKFTAESDLSLGDEVMIYGTLKMYNTTPEFNSNNYIVQLKHGSEPEVKSLQVAAAEYRTYVATANLVVPAGVKAYIATGETASTLTLTSVAKIKEGTPVILNAAEGYYTFEITDETVTYPATNLLKISDGTAVK